jgi:thymidylate synthase
MIQLAPEKTIEDQDFHQAWARAAKFCLKRGVPIVFGTLAEPKNARDTVQKIILTGKAIGQIEKREIHPNFPFKQISRYCDEYTRKYLEEYLKKPEDKRFAYLYFERLAHYEASDGSAVDQLVLLREQIAEQIETGIVSNRAQMITWERKKDDRSKAPPCLQSIWPRPYLPTKGDGAPVVDVHLRWRSRDLMSAWQANLICVAEMLDREVFIPNKCKIARIIDDNDSLHAYEADLWIAESLPISPQFASI